MKVANAADYLIEIVVNGIKDGKSIDWPTIWEESPEAQGVKQEVSELRKTSDEKTGGSAGKDLSGPALLDQIILLTKRTSRQFWRSPEYP